MTSSSEKISVLIDDQIVDGIPVEKIKAHINIWDWVNLKKYSYPVGNSIHFDISKNHLALMNKANSRNETNIKPRLVYGSAYYPAEEDTQKLLALNNSTHNSYKLPSLAKKMIPKEFENAEFISWNGFVYGKRDKEKYISVENTGNDERVTLVFIDKEKYKEKDRYWLDPKSNIPEGKLNFIEYDLKKKEPIRICIDGIIFFSEEEAIKYKAKIEIELHKKSLLEKEKKTETTVENADEKRKEKIRKLISSESSWNKFSDDAKKLLLSDVPETFSIEIDESENKLHKLRIPGHIFFEQIKPGEYREVSYEIINALAKYLKEYPNKSIKQFFNESDEFILADYCQHIKTLKTEIPNVSFQNEKKNKVHISFERKSSRMIVEIDSLPKFSVDIMGSKEFVKEEFKKQIKSVIGLGCGMPNMFTFLTPEMLTSRKFVSVLYEGQVANKATYDKSSIYLRNKEAQGVINLFDNEKEDAKALSEYLKIVELEPNIGTKALEQKLIAAIYPEINKVFEEFGLYKTPQSFSLKENYLTLYDQKQKSFYCQNIKKVNVEKLKASILINNHTIPKILFEKMESNELKLVSSIKELEQAGVAKEPHSLIFETKNKIAWLTDHKGDLAFKVVTELEDENELKNLLELYEFLKKRKDTSEIDYLLYFIKNDDSRFLPLAKLFKVIYDKNIQVKNLHQYVNNLGSLNKENEFVLVWDQSYLELYKNNNLQRKFEIAKPEDFNSFIKSVIEDINLFSITDKPVPETEKIPPLTAAATVVSVAESVISAAANKEIKEKPNMAKTTIQEKAIQVIRSDAQETAKRVAVLRMSKVIQDGLVKVLTQDLKGKNKNQTKKAFEEFFSTEKGIATIQIVAGVVLPYVQKYLPEKYHNYVDIVATEMRVQGGTTASLEVIGAVEPIIKLLASGVMDSFSSMNAVSEFVRVDTEVVESAKPPQAEVVELSSVKNGEVNKA